jgi:hypothetical protein
MTALATAERPQAAAPQARIIPFIDPANVVVDSSGYVRKSRVVRLPKDFVADDLKELFNVRRLLSWFSHLQLNEVPAKQKHFPFSRELWRRPA